MEKSSATTTTILHTRAHYTKKALLRQLFRVRNGNHYCYGVANSCVCASVVDPLVRLKTTDVATGRITAVFPPNFLTFDCLKGMIAPRCLPENETQAAIPAVALRGDSLRFFPLC